MLRTITPPSSDPVSLAELKAHLRVDFVDDDALISSLSTVATIHAQNKTQRRFVKQTLELVLQSWADGRIRIPVAPVLLDGIVSIKYVDFSGVTQTLDPTAYVVKTDGYTVSIIATYGTIWPIVFPFSPEPIVIRFTAGETDPANVAPNIKHAIKMMVGHFYENRNSVVVAESSRANAIAVPQAVDDLLLAEAWN
jgi:uncharacterized phiE125 gp8 family phage protein